jgi:methionine-rich copper-binding protein CopC
LDSSKRHEETSRTTTMIIETGNKFAYDTINNNGNKNENENETEAHTISNLSVDERFSSKSPEAIVNIINENNEKIETSSISSSTTTSLNDVIENEEDLKTDNHQNQQKQNIHIDESDNNNNSDNSISNQKTVNSIDSTKTAQTAELSANHTLKNHYETQRFISELIKYKADNVTIKKSWGKWSDWSSCSRSCGEGVMFQSRECMEKT